MKFIVYTLAIAQTVINDCKKKGICASYSPAQKNKFSIFIPDGESVDNKTKFLATLRKFPYETA